MSLARIRDEHHVPARIDQKVSIFAACGYIHGAIIGHDGDLILFKGWDGNTYSAHPDDLNYLEQI